jgi:thiol:disulfide interchange protein DsbD
VNERLALRAAAVEERFRRLEIAAFKADWTLYDERITEALRSFGRSGVPLYVLYPPGGEARLLPEVITPALVLNALDEALGAPRQAASAAPAGALSTED